jgi:hypothetical protein
MLEHYQSRLRLAFERHVTLCRSYYTSAARGVWWDREIGLLDRGLEWVRARAAKEWKYRLQGFDLVAI